jgi:archaellum component FlaF (FlaF/FlaG flagellin family)
MGFATSAAVAILFLGITILASITYPVMIDSFSKVQRSIDDKHEIQMDELNTRINIISSVSSGVHISITLSNNGSTVLHSSKSNVLFDGNCITYSVTPTGLWLPGENAVFTVNAGTSGSHRIKIITENGISAYTSVHNGA